MSEYDKLRAKNIAERNAILAKIFKESKDDNKPKTQGKVPRKRKVVSDHKENKNNNDDNDDGVEDTEEHEQSENEPPKKRKYVKSKTIVKREYNLRARPARLNITPESSVSDDDSTTNHEKNHHAYKTRSWYHQRQEENDGMTTRSKRKKNYLEEKEEMEEESIESSEAKEKPGDSQLTVVSQVETTAGSTEDEKEENPDEKS